MKGVKRSQRKKPKNLRRSYLKGRPRISRSSQESAGSKQKATRDLDRKLENPRKANRPDDRIARKDAKVTRGS